MPTTYVRRPEVDPEVAEELATLATQIDMLEAALIAKRDRRNSLFISEVDRGVMMAPLGRCAGLDRRTVKLICDTWRNEHGS